MFENQSFQCKILSVLIPTDKKVPYKKKVGFWFGIASWYTETPLTKPFLANPEIINLVLQRTPMARIAQADEVSGIVAFLSMNHASYITGQVIAVDGGFLRYGFY